MTEEHPITPSPELIKDWCASKIYAEQKTSLHVHVAMQAARWGADQELEACCEWLSTYGHTYEIGLRSVRRPEPTSLKQQALDRCNDYIDPDGIIRLALESLPD